MTQEEIDKLYKAVGKDKRITLKVRKPKLRTGKDSGGSTN